MKTKDQIWTCPCGKKHIINHNEPTICMGKGHYSYRAKTFWNYDPKKAIQKELFG